MKDNTVSFQTLAKRSQNQKKILDAAEKVFAEAGFAGATTQLIADVANLPKANVHYYFKTKQDIYRQVVYNIFDIFYRGIMSKTNIKFYSSNRPCS